MWHGRKLVSGWLSLAVPAIILLLLTLRGFTWGLPSPERNALYFTDGFAPERVPQLGADDLARAWDLYPVSLPGASRLGQYPRSAFNPLRSYHPDEYVILKSLARMSPGRGDFFPGFFSWPAAYIYGVGAVLGVAHLAGLAELRRDLAFYYAHPEAMARLYLLGRGVTLLFALGCVVVLGAAAQQLYARAAGFIAATALAVAPAFVANARYMTADISMLFWVCLAFYGAVRIAAETGSGRLRRWYILAGAAVGLAGATRYQGALAAFGIMTAHILARVPARPQRGDAGERGLRCLLHGLGDLLLAGAVSVAVFLALNPYILCRFGEFREALLKEAASTAGASWPTVLVIYPWAGLSGPLALLAGFGLVASVWRRARADLLVLGAFLPVALALLAARPHMLRYLLPALPLAPLCAARAWGALAGEGAWRRRWLFATALTCAALFWALLVTLAWSNLYAGEDPRLAAGRYIAERVPAGARVGVLAVPWQFDMPPLDDRRYEVVVLAEEADALHEAAPDIVVVSDFQRPPLRIGDPLTLRQEEFWRALGKGRAFGAAACLLGLEWLPVLPSLLPIHDLRYPNPTIWVVERDEQEGLTATSGATPGGQVP